MQAQTETQLIQALQQIAVHLANINSKLNQINQNLGSVAAKTGR